MAAGELPVPKLYEDERCFVIADIAPKAPLHCLVIPKEHLRSAAQVDGAGQEALSGHLVAVAAGWARKKGLESDGYRLVMNHGPAAGQTVMHLHLHLLGGRSLGEMG